MNRRLTEISDFLDASRAGVYAAIDGIGAGRLEQVPVGGGWTAAQVLQHLSLAESKTTQYLAARLGKAIAEGLAHEQDESSVLATADGSTLPAQLVAPDAVTPAAVVAAGDAVAALRASHDEMRGLLGSADGWALGDVQTRHALLGPLNMYQSLLFIGYHDRRHTPQIARAVTAR